MSCSWADVYKVVEECPASKILPQKWWPYISLKLWSLSTKKAPSYSGDKNVYSQRRDHLLCHIGNMYNEQTDARLIDSLIYSSLLIAPTCFNANASSSGSS
jgi:hypothetical protein